MPEPVDTVASRELRNNTAGVLRRVAAGEQLDITVNGERRARLAPLPTSRRRWMSREEFADLLANHQADPGLRDDLAWISGDTTDDLPPLW